MNTLHFDSLSDIPALLQTDAVQTQTVIHINIIELSSSVQTNTPAEFD